MTESIIRQDKLTKQWVIFSPSRGKRPNDFKKTALERGQLPPIDKKCPFCPGNEHMLTPIILEMKGAHGNEWQTRVITNKFPALTPLGDTDRTFKGIYLTMKGYGQHEVIIESPKHNLQLAMMPEADVKWIIETYHRRYSDVMKNHKNMMAIIFRNHGAEAGTSLVHPHSQLIVTGIVPHHIRWREAQAEEYYDEWGRCLSCDMLEFEMKDQERVILENASFLAFIPFAAEVPFEVWIMPKQHQPDFGGISDEEKADLSSALQTILHMLYEKLSDPDYNYVINTSARFRADEPQLHWYLQVRPRLTTRAGFEIGSGICINPSLPEADASFLRNQTT